MVGNIDNRMLAVERDKYVDWVNLALEAYQGSSIDELRVRFDLDEIHSYDIDKWVYFAIEKKVKRLVMKFQKCMAYVYNEKVYSFPPLRDTFKTLHYCRSLIALELNCVNISGGVVEYFIASCPYLRQLSVKYSDSLADLKVSGESLCLEYLKIVHCNKLKSIYISAENLLSFVYSGRKIKISFANVPNLVELSFDGIYTLHYIPQASNFAAQLVTLELKVLMPERKVPGLKLPLLAHLKNFKLKASGCDDHSLLFFPQLIEAAPSLSRFTLEFIWLESSLVKTRKRKKTPNLLHHCLKVVELVGFVGQAIDMEFAMYLLKNVIALEKIVIDPLHQDLIGHPLTDQQLTEIQTIRQRVMELKSKFSLGDRLVLRNF